MSLVISDNLAYANTPIDVAACDAWQEMNGNIAADPKFCSVDSNDFSVSSNSPAFTHAHGPLGAIPEPGCKDTPLMRATWSSVKLLPMGSSRE